MKLFMVATYNMTFLQFQIIMQSLELILCNKTQRVTIFKIPPLSTSKGYYLDDWKQMIWQGGVKVSQKNREIKIAFIDKNGKVFGQTKVPPNYKQAIVKTIDSSRGYAVRLQNPRGGYLWVGVVFRDRNDAFDFGVVFQDEANRNYLHQNPNMLKEEFSQKVDFSLKKGEKIKVAIGSEARKQKKNQAGRFPPQNPFDFNFGFASSSTSVSNQKIQTKPQKNNDWANFEFGSSESTSTNKKPANNTNLLDFD